MTGTVVAVSRSATHSFSKQVERSIRLLVGLGVEGDAHMGKTVQHRYLIRTDPTRLNNRQVHLIQAEVIDELRDAGFDVYPGEMGENITTRGLDLLAMPVGTRLSIGATVVVALTELRDPCGQLDDFRQGLKGALSDHDAHGDLLPKAGVMGIVIASGVVEPGDVVRVELPPAPHVALAVG